MDTSRPCSILQLRRGSSTISSPYSPAVRLWRRRWRRRLRRRRSLGPHEALQDQEANHRVRQRKVMSSCNNRLSSLNVVSFQHPRRHGLPPQGPGRARLQAEAAQQPAGDPSARRRLKKKLGKIARYRRNYNRSCMKYATTLHKVHPFHFIITILAFHSLAELKLDWP